MSILDKILLLAIIGAVFFVAKVLKIRWYSPAGVYTLASVAYIGGAVFVFGGDVEYKLWGIVWWLLSCLACMLGQKISLSFVKPAPLPAIPESNGGNAAPAIRYRKTPWILLVFIIFIAFAGIMLSLMQKGISLSSLLDISQLGQINHNAAVDRYEGNSEASLVSQLFVIFYYFAPLCGGYMFNFSDGKLRKVITLLSLCPALLSMAFFNGKSTFIAACMLWGSAFLVSLIKTKRDKIKLKVRWVIGVALAFVAVIVLLYISMCLRVGDLSAETRAIINEKILVYAFGHVEAFPLWIETVELGVYDFGANTFMIIPRMLGLAVREQGVYGFMGNSNVFTANRGIIQDFGVFGGLIFWFVIGLISNHFIKNVIRKKRSFISTTLLVASFFFVLYGSLIISPWIYTSYVAAFVAFAAFVAVAELNRR